MIEVLIGLVIGAVIVWLLLRKSDSKTGDQDSTSRQPNLITISVYI